MRRLLALLLLLAPGPAMAQVAVSGANPTQNNNNQAVGQASSNQVNESRAESVGGSMYNTQINNSMGELGEMTISSKAISCQSPSLYANAGVVPTDAYGFYTFDDRDREMMYAPQAQIGFQMPFGPQVAACIEAMKDQALQVKIATEAGTITKCLQVRKAATDAGFELAVLADGYPTLTERCGVIWGVDKVAMTP